MCVFLSATWTCGHPESTLDDPRLVLATPTATREQKTFPGRLTVPCTRLWPALHSLAHPPNRSTMASRETVYEMKRALKRLGLPIYGNKSAPLERCRLSGASRSMRVESTGPPVGPTNVSECERPLAGSGSAPARADTAVVGSCGIRYSAGARTDPDAPAADGPAPEPAELELPVVPSTISPLDPSPVRAAPPTAAAAAGSSTWAPPFSKHEKVRLAHVMCTGEVAAGVVVLRGPMSRRQQDDRARRDAVRVVVVAEMFNSTDQVADPDECADAVEFQR